MRIFPKAVRGAAAALAVAVAAMAAGCAGGTPGAGPASGPASVHPVAATASTAAGTPGTVPPVFAASLTPAKTGRAGGRLALLSSRTGALLRWLTPQPQGATDEVLSQRDGWVYFVSYPIDNYCVTFNIGKYAHFNDEYVSSDKEKLTLDYYVLPKDLEKAEEQFKQVKTMLAIYEKYFGKYPFYRDGYKLVECPHTGMEHQTCVAYGNHFLGGYRGRSSSEVGLKFDFIIIHESAHEWWGNNVAMKDIADMWIHESFGAYAESLFVEDQYGHAEAIKYINGKKGNVRNDQPIIAEYGRYQKSPGDMYDKGQLILNTLRSVLDDDVLWFSILRGLQDKFKHQNVSAEEVFGYINQKSGRDLTYFFDQYFRHANIPTLAVQTTKEGDSVTARYRWEADGDNFRMPIKVTTAPGKYELITPTTEWQTNKLNGIAPEDFKAAEDLFYVKVRLRWSYLDPRRGNAP